MNGEPALEPTSLDGGDRGSLVDGRDPGAWRFGRWIIPAAIIAILLTVHAFSWTDDHVGANEDHSRNPNGPWIAQDLRDTGWLPARDLWNGGNPYDIDSYLHRVPPGTSTFFLYTPATMLVFAPIAVLPWDTAVVAWTAIGVLLIALLAWLTVGAARLPKRIDLLLAIMALLLLVLPTQLMFQTGNLSLAIVCGTFLALTRRRNDWITAIAIAVALLKLQFGVPTVLLLLVIGLWRPILRGAVLALLASIPPLVLAIAHSSGLSQFVDAIVHNISSQRQSEYGNLTSSGAYRWDLAGTLGRTTGINFATGVQLAMTAAVLVLGCLAFRRVLTRSQPDVGLAAAIGALTVLLAFFHNRYDLVLAFPAVIVLLARSPLARRQRHSLWLLPWLAAALIFGVGFHAERIDRTLGISADTAQALNGLAIFASFLLLLIAAYAKPRREHVVTDPPVSSPDLVVDS